MTQKMHQDDFDDAGEVNTMFNNHRDLMESNGVGARGATKFLLEQLELRRRDPKGYIKEVAKTAGINGIHFDDENQVSQTPSPIPQVDEKTKKMHGELQEFGKDKKDLDEHIPHMTYLMENGLADNLQDAYDGAKLANKKSRSSVMEQVRSEIENSGARNASKSLRPSVENMSNKDAPYNKKSTKESMLRAYKSLGKD